MLSNKDRDFLMFITLMSGIKREKNKKRKRIWCKEWYKLRYHFTHEHLQKVLEATSPDDYKNFLRMDDVSYKNLLLKVEPIIRKQDTNMRQAIPVNQRLSITLRYLASGMDLEDLKFTSAIHPRTLEIIIMETCEAIIEVLKDFLKMPRTCEDWLKIAQEYEQCWNFPHCIGSVDGKHIEIQNPANSGSYYYNYKGTYSIVLMAIVNANYEFLMVDVGANGRISDGGVLKNTTFWNLLVNNQLNIPEPCSLPSFNKELPFVFIGDEAFQLTPNLMKPYNRTALTDNTRIFNYRLSRARIIVESSFGILSSRFKILKKAIPLAPNKVRKIVLACCYLHNYLSKRNTYIRRGDVDHEDTSTGNLLRGSWRSEERQLIPLQGLRGNIANEAKKVRNDYCEYFNTSGAVPWQTNSLNNN